MHSRWKEDDSVVSDGIRLISSQYAGFSDGITRMGNCVAAATGGPGVRMGVGVAQVVRNSTIAVIRKKGGEKVRGLDILGGLIFLNQAALN